MDYTLHGILQARILEWVSLSLLQGIFPTQESNPGTHIAEFSSKWVSNFFFIQNKLKSNTDVCTFVLLYTDAPISSKVIADMHPKNPFYLLWRAKYSL